MNTWEGRSSDLTVTVARICRADKLTQFKVTITNRDHDRGHTYRLNVNGFDGQQSPIARKSVTAIITATVHFEFTTIAVYQGSGVTNRAIDKPLHNDCTK
ncbi:MAG TPA: hypothetical protein VLF69_06225 [Candidatus Saccharimonadales bacterium]|nr:hypothetical protein [Candidatus Saccharimonadales bacterium]